MGNYFLDTQYIKAFTTGLSVVALIPPLNPDIIGEKYSLIVLGGGVSQRAFWYTEHDCLSFFCLL